MLNNTKVMQPNFNPHTATVTKVSGTKVMQNWFAEALESFPG